MATETLKPVSTQKIDIGPAVAYFGADGIPDADYLGRTQGAMTLEYSIGTFELQTEEDGVVDETINEDTLEITVPLVYTDVDTLSLIVPWAHVVEHGTETGNKRLIVPKAVGRRLSDYADKLHIRPIAMIDALESTGETVTDDPSKDVTIHRCYPRPGPISFGYSREGTRIANVTFVALEAEEAETVEIDGSEIDVYPYFSIGDNSIDGKEI